MRFFLIFELGFYLFCIGTVQSQELTIYTMPAPKKMDWESPKKLIKSCLLNKIVKSPYGENRHPIGHMVIELKDSTRYEMVGMAPETSLLPMNKITKEGYGLGVLFAVIDGKLERKEINVPQVEERVKNGDIAFVNYKINQAVFDRLWLYLVDYQYKGYDQFYNGGNRPREGAGCGCSAFAISFLEVAGIEDLLPIEEWKVNVLVPDEFIGGPYCDNKKVPFYKLFFAQKWADESTNTESYESLSLYEPTKIYNWILKKHYSPVSLPNVFKAVSGNAKGLVVDARTQAFPTEPIWYVQNDKK
ncbi:hypothetical protein [Flavobacterium agrisoli]|uniref:Uncharacterized protein n=1 Tax=Flavobacterium agrisoli TaxID=2793066 RepID=A0A934PP89_9FLAO|nr:hypothetical protein [Flavobacterium agrisoli]MBK0370116.1 hypothetical protein [Flavobacterium agrisoli]